MRVGELAALGLTAWSALSSSVSLRASLSRVLPSREHHGTPSQTVSVRVIRPCAGAEPSLADTLRSSRALRGRVPFELIFAVARDDDAALPIARAVADELRAEGMRVDVLVTHAAGVNQKASQLAVVQHRYAPCDYVANVDSDVDCAGITVDDLVAPFAREASLAALWVPVVEDGGSTFGDRASDALLAGSLHAFPLLSSIDRGGLVSKAVMLRTRDLDRAGGFADLERHLGEDMELARRLQALGLTTRAHRAVLTSRARGRSWDAVVTRYARWLAVIRAQRPALMASYPALFFSTWPLVLGAAVTFPVAGRLRPALAVGCAVAVGARLAVAVAARHAAKHPLRRALADTVLADALLASAFVRALSTRAVHWRGRTLVIDPGGLLREA